MRKIFEWVGQERCSIGEVCRRLQRDGVPTRTGKSAWDRAVIWSHLKNPAYKGTAAFGKTRSGAVKPQRLRPQRGRPEQPRRPISRVDTSSEDQTLIAVPGLVSEELFGAVQAQLEENRQRRRDRPRGGRYLLQGLVVCKRCGYGCYGKPVSRASAKGKVPYAYYRCTGSDAYRFGGQRLCWNKQLRTDVLDAAVWEDVRHLLSEPERVRAEYERRLQGPETGPEREVKHLNKMIANLKKMISRLIDAYGDGLLDKSEFEPRILAARERLAKLEDECRQRIDEANQEVELRLVIGQLEEFAKRVSQELQEPDWDTRREVVRALVKKVEIDEQEVRIVYRVSPSPFEGGPQQGSLQHCWGRASPHVWGTCTFHEPSARCPNRAATVRAHNWVILGALLHEPEKPAWFLPTSGRLYFRKSQLPVGPDGIVEFRTKCELAVELLREQACIIKGKHLAVFDGGYALESVVRPLVLPAGGAPRIDFLTRLRCDARLYALPLPPEQRPKGKPGPQPKWGQRLEPPRRGGMWKAKWQVGTAFVYGRQRTIRWKEIICLWRVLGWEVPVKAIVASVEGYKERFTLVTSAVELTGLQMVELFTARFRQEDGFRDLKQRLGWEECRAWTANPIQRTSQAQWVTMSLLRLLQFRLEASGKVGWWFRPPWNKKKDRPSVLDGLRLMRRHRGRIQRFLSKREGNERITEGDAA